MYTESVNLAWVKSYYCLYCCSKQCLALHNQLHKIYPWFRVIWSAESLEQMWWISDIWQLRNRKGGDVHPICRQQELHACVSVQHLVNKLNSIFNSRFVVKYKQEYEKLSYSELIFCKHFYTHTPSPPVPSCNKEVTQVPSQWLEMQNYLHLLWRTLSGSWLPTLSLQQLQHFTLQFRPAAVISVHLVCHVLTWMQHFQSMVPPMSCHLCPQ